MDVIETTRALGLAVILDGSIVAILRRLEKSNPRHSSARQQARPLAPSVPTAVHRYCSESSRRVEPTTLYDRTDWHGPSLVTWGIADGDTAGGPPADVR
jgi:hypothetical protein